MFDQEKESPRKQVWVITASIAALAVVGVLLYTLARPRPKASVSVPTGGPSQVAPADAPRDLELVRAVMGKDVTGTRVMWSVQLRNKSGVYAYSDIQYEARFLSPDGTSLGGSEGIIKETIEPGEEKKIPPFIGGIFEARAARYQFLVRGAKASSR